MSPDDCKNTDVDLWFLALPNGLAEPYVNALLSKDDVKNAFKNENLNVINNIKELKKYLKKHYTENTNLLLMSSGNFNKLSYNEI